MILPGINLDHGTAVRPACYRQATATAGAPIEPVSITFQEVVREMRTRMHA